jgi:2',3'-cyclic-nucleotide 2'-phosphodiesterase (5'-nucleotidase family)
MIGPAAALLALALPAQAFPPCRAGAASQKIDLVFVSDLHSSYNPQSAIESPYARIRGLYEKLEKENPYTLLLDGGDDFEKGSVAEQISKGSATLEITRAMGFDVRTLGNHDFAWGPDILLEHSKDPRAVTLAGNVRYLGGEPGRYGAVDYAELQVGCVKVGFFGLINKPWNGKNEPYDGPFLASFSSRYDFVQRAREIVEAHRKDVGLLVMLSHLGLEDDRAVAAAVPGIDLVLGGHTHDVLHDPERVGGAAIVHPGKDAEYIARLSLSYDLKRS